MQRGILRLRECQSRLVDLEWITGFRTGVQGRTYEEFIERYNAFAMFLLYVLVGQVPLSLPFPDNILLFLYRARRCFVETEFLQDPLDFVRSFKEPIMVPLYTRLELHESLSKSFAKKTFVITRLKFQAVFSNKATMEYERKHGGFNAYVGCIARLVDVDHIEVPSDPSFTGRCLSTFHVAELAYRDKTLFSQAVSASIDIMRALTRPPIAYVFIIPERSSKARVPTLPEGFCGILSRYVSGIGKEIQKRLFPITTNRSAIRMKHVPGSIYLSGDYRDSTSYLSWESAIVGWFHIFTQAGMDKEELDLHMEIIKFLIGPHQFFSDKSERTRYAAPFQYENQIRPFQSGRRDKKDCLPIDSAYLLNRAQKSDVPHSFVGIRSRDPPRSFCRPPFGQPIGGVGHEYTSYPPSDGLMDFITNFRLGAETITSIRGLIMAYSIAAPALHVVGAIPHWRFPKVVFLITGDDNASRHPSNKSIDALEQEKWKTGMVPHTKEKSARGERGVLLAEELLVVPPGAVLHTPLVRVKNFPVRILFPQFSTDWHAITMPEAAYNNFKEICDKNVREKIIGFIYWKYKKIYDRLEVIGITPFGEDSIFKDRSSPKGFKNSTGGLSYAEVFRRPGSTEPAWTSDAVLPLISQRSEVRDVVCGTVDAIKENSMTEVFLTLDDLRHSLGHLQVETAYRPRGASKRELGFIDQVVENLRLLETPDIPKDFKVEVGWTYPSEEQQGFGHWDLNSVILPGEETPENPLKLVGDRDTPFAEGIASEPVRLPYVARGMVFDKQEISTLSSDREEKLDEASRLLAELDFEFCQDEFAGEFDFDYVDPYALDTPQVVEHPLFAASSGTGISSNVRHAMNTFTDELPSGADFRDILNRASHLFVDVRNLRSGNKAYMDLPDLIRWWAGRKSSCVVWFVMETPGKPVFLRDGQTIYVRATPRRNGRAGADLEFRHLLDLIGSNTSARYRSSDPDWGRIFNARHQE